MQELIEKMGGAEATEKRLDLMFVPKLRTVDLGVGVASGTTLFNPGEYLVCFIYFRNVSYLYSIPH